MKSLHYVIVEVNQEYINEKTIGDVRIVTNNTIESVANINRIAKVISAPAGTVLQAGDEVIIHHNILRTANGYRGQKVYSEYWVTDNLYFLPPTEIFAYKRNGIWNAVNPFCFIKPIEALQDTQIIQAKQESTHKGNVKLRGSVWLLNDDLEKQGVKIGDEVLFTPHSEYEFEIDNLIYYKMSTKDVVAVI